MPTNTNDARDARAEGRSPRARTSPGHRPRKRFQKDRATLWLLTVALGLGLGAAARFVQRADHARATAASAPAVDAAQARRYAPTPYQSQRVAVLPGRSYPSRATSRMS